jgi:polyisoprenoid-binding protein YceI
LRRTPAWLATLLGLQLLAGAAPADAAASWQTNAAESSLGFTAVQAGGEFDGSFASFNPDIVFDPGDLAGSRFSVSIDTGSVDTGDRERDAALKGGEFFASGRWPTARFEASRFSSAGPGRFEATGRLTIRDVTRDVTIGFSFEPGPDGRTARLRGGTAIRRLDFGVGQGEWRDTAWIGDEVKIRFSLLLQRK